MKYYKYSKEGHFKKKYLKIKNKKVLRDVGELKKSSKVEILKIETCNSFKKALRDADYKRKKRLTDI
jgi:hypothetical protein